MKKIFWLSVLFLQLIISAPVFAERPVVPGLERRDPIPDPIDELVAETVRSQHKQPFVTGYKLNSAPTNLSNKVVTNPDGTLTVTTPSGSVNFKMGVNGKYEVVGANDAAGVPVSDVILQKIKENIIPMAEGAGLYMMAQYTLHELVRYKGLLDTPYKAGAALRGGLKTGSGLVGKIAPPAVIALTAYDLATTNNSEYALDRYMDSIKRCRTLIAGNISAFNAFLSALEGRIKQASVVISSNLGGDDMLDLISGGASSDAIRNAMRSGLNNMNNEEDCKSIVNELKTDPKFVDGLNDLGAKTVVNSPILYTNDNPISKHPNPGLEQFDFERHIKELEAANRNRPRVLMQQEYDRIMRPDLFRGGIYIPSQYQNQKKVRQ